MDFLSVSVLAVVLQSKNRRGIFILMTCLCFQRQLYRLHISVQISVNKNCCQTFNLWRSAILSKWPWDRRHDVVSCFNYLNFIQIGEFACPFRFLHFQGIFQNQYKINQWAFCNSSKILSTNWYTIHKPARWILLHVLWNHVHILY